MDAVEVALSTGETECIPALLSDKWLADATLFGAPSQIREGVEAYFDLGVMPVLSPVSTTGSPWAAYDKIFALYRR